MPSAATHQIDVTADARFGRSAPLSQLLLRLKAASGGGVTLFPSRRPAGFGYSPTNELNPSLAKHPASHAVRPTATGKET